MSYIEVEAEPVVRSAVDGVALRAAALGAGFAAMVVPLVSATAMGWTHSMTLWQVAGWSALAPAAVAMTLVAPRLGRMGDAVATAVTAVVAGHAGMVALDAGGQVSSYTALMQGSGDFAYGQFSQAMGVTASPGLGLLAIAGSAVLMAVATLRPR
jgi:hypothetical protein